MATQITILPSANTTTAKSQSAFTATPITSKITTRHNDELPACGYPMDNDDKYGCPNCLGEGFDVIGRDEAYAETDMYGIIMDAQDDVLAQGE